MAGKKHSAENAAGNPLDRGLMTRAYGELLRLKGWLDGAFTVTPIKGRREFMLTGAALAAMGPGEVIRTAVNAGRSSLSAQGAALYKARFSVATATQGSQTISTLRHLVKLAIDPEFRSLFPGANDKVDNLSGDFDGAARLVQKALTHMAQADEQKFALNRFLLEHRGDEELLQDIAQTIADSEKNLPPLLRPSPGGILRELKNQMYTIMSSPQEIESALTHLTELRRRDLYREVYRQFGRLPDGAKPEDINKARQDLSEETRNMWHPEVANDLHATHTTPTENEQEVDCYRITLSHRDTLDSLPDDLRKSRDTRNIPNLQNQWRVGLLHASVVSSWPSIQMPFVFDDHNMDAIAKNLRESPDKLLILPEKNGIQVIVPPHEKSSKLSIVKEQLDALVAARSQSQTHEAKGSVVSDASLTTKKLVGRTMA